MSRRVVIRGLAALAAWTSVSAAALPAAAHQLIVFASVEGDAVIVETKFSNGKRPKTGLVTVTDGGEAILLSLPIGENGVTRFPLADTPNAATTGLQIEVDLGSGHEDYWILTPQDITKQSADGPSSQ